ncbi:DUF2000 domain-containing protein [Candidatus Pantoea floridensis]|uniref:DUF2000 domain-containing protein n=1 Tax=Candidatus Pantoea floridensis TaxID=1938870 RepID=A0A286BWE5_9GAMM|nr:DUF2000 domain-containing protein [Pantoea floridensis]PIF20938.1 hypothetical protein BX596_0312 [Enterobacteriaceae bacterium JKS000233]SOD38454.1 hypothetical protein SAMN06273570_2870 [Pantoea floridensis]
MTDKMVIVVEGELERGVAANVIGLLGVSIGYHVQGIVGPDVVDANGVAHRGMSMVGLPVLVADRETLRSIYEQVLQIRGLTVLDVSDAAVASRDYTSYTNTLQDPDKSSRPLGLAIHGPRAQVNQVTGRLGLLR